MHGDAAGDADADRGDLAVLARRPGRAVAAHPHARAALDPLGGQAQPGAHGDEGVLQTADVGDDVDRVRQPDQRVADQLAGAVPRDPPAPVDVDDGGAVGGPVVRVGPLAGGVDGLVLEQQQPAGRRRRRPGRAPRAAAASRPGRGRARAGAGRRRDPVVGPSRRVGGPSCGPVRRRSPWSWPRPRPPPAPPARPGRPRGRSGRRSAVVHDLQVHAATRRRRGTPAPPVLGEGDDASAPVGAVLRAARRAPWRSSLSSVREMVWSSTLVSPATSCCDSGPGHRGGR